MSLEYINQWSSPNEIFKVYLIHFYGARGGAIVWGPALQLEGRGFDSRWFHWKFFIDIILPAALCPWG